MYIKIYLQLNFFDVVTAQWVRGSEGKSNGSGNSSCSWLVNVAELTHTPLILFLYYWTRPNLWRIVYSGNVRITELYM